MARLDRAISLPIVVMPMARSGQDGGARGHRDCFVASLFAMAVVRGHAGPALPSRFRPLDSVSRDRGY
jgi:hypothetical protein